MEKVPSRKIIHIDMDAFYASVEQRDNPSLKNRPVAVGGKPENRGVIAACSYQARMFGVKSAMPSAQALKLCPGLILLPPRFGAYGHVSRLIHRIFKRYTDVVEPLSLDEAYLDVTANKSGEGSATAIAIRIKKQIRQRTGLTASAGVSYNKFLAKCASDHDKPDGLTVVTPQGARRFIEALEVRKFPGIGPVTEARLKQIGIHNGADLARLAKSSMKEIFGNSTDFFIGLCKGIDTRPVEVSREAKSCGREHTYPSDILQTASAEAQLGILTGEVFSDMAAAGHRARTLTLKVKYHDFRTVTRRMTMEEPFTEQNELYQAACALLKKTEAGRKRIRLLGISLSGFEGAQGQQLKLFE